MSNPKAAKASTPVAKFVAADDSIRADPLAYVVSKNLRRRHLDESQRAAAAARLTEMFEEEARLRTGGRPKTSGNAEDKPGANLHQVSETRSTAKAAKMLNVSTRTVASAKRVLDEGEPELFEAVERGEIAVSAAATLTKLPKAEQRKIAADPKAAKAKASKIRKEKAAAPKPKSKPTLVLLPNTKTDWERACVRKVNDCLDAIIADANGRDLACIVALCRKWADALEGRKDVKAI